MHMVFIRNIGSTGVDVILDENWDILKRELARQFPVEMQFDAHDGWGRLRSGDVILHEGAFYHYVDTTNMASEQTKYAEGAVSLFKGEVIEFTEEDELR